MLSKVYPLPRSGLNKFAKLLIWKQLKYNTQKWNWV